MDPRPYAEVALGGPADADRAVRAARRAIARAASANLVPVSLELGGKGANIVFDDAELGPPPSAASATPASAAKAGVLTTVRP